MNQAAPALVSQSLDAHPWRLTDQRGKVMVLSFWSTWCGPCVASMPEYKELQKRFGGRADFQLVGVALDSDAATVKAFCAAQELTWLQLFEPGKESDNSIARAFEVDGVPYQVLIDKQGKIRAYGHYIDALDQRIEALLKESAPPHP